MSLAPGSQRSWLGWGSAGALGPGPHVLAVALLLLTGAAPVCDAVWRDPARNRDLPIRIRLPEGRARVPVILFSPGLGGGIGGGSVWARAWVDRGFAVVHLEHPGSDAAVYRGAASPEDRRDRVRAAASADQLVARTADASFILDELARRAAEGPCDLNRLDPARIGFAGHSMGAWTAQGLAGQRFSGAPGFAGAGIIAGPPRLADRRIRAAIAFSPAALTGAADLAASFGGITIPFLSVTGSLDGDPPANASADPARMAAARAAADIRRTGPFTGMPPGDKYLLVFDGGPHMAFAGNKPTASHIERLIIAATTAFWGATLLDDPAGTAFLTSGLKRELAPGDRFESK